MKKSLLRFIAIITAALSIAPCYAATFKTSMVSVDQARAALSPHLMKAMSGPAIYQLYVCNITQLPSQTGTPITVAFPGTGAPAQTPQPGSCAYLSSDQAFSTPVNIYVPAGNPSPSFNNLLSSGQMWSVAYNAQTGAYSFSRSE